MAFTVTFCKTSDEDIVLNKTYTDTLDVNISTPLGPIDLLNMELIISYSESLLSRNYAYISAFGKYYFVKWELNTDERLTAHLEEDVLMSNKTGIENLTCIITRATIDGEGNSRPTYVEDDLLPFDSWQSVDTIVASSSIHDNAGNVAYTLMIHTV